MKFLFAFGDNEDGQCGRVNKKDQKDIYYPTLVRFPSFVEITKVSAGSRHSLALSRDGFVYSWGWGHVGSLGHGNYANLYHPTKVESLSQVIEISAGGMHSACINSAFKCYSWGCNSYGQLGLGEQAHENMRKSVNIPTIVKKSPKEVNDSSELLVTKISCGGMHTAAIGIDNSVYCWGKADNGQLGCSLWYLSFSMSISFPKKLEGYDIGKPIDISCGSFYTLIVNDIGQVYAMGKDDFGCLGVEVDTNNLSIGMEKPTKISSLKNETITQISAGGWHSLFANKDGKIYSCGKGEYGRLGLGNEMAKQIPQEVNLTNSSEPLDSILLISAGGSHSLWVNYNHHIFSVGRLDNGRCGLGRQSSTKSLLSNDISPYFYQGYGGFHISNISAGGAHSLVLLDYPDVNLANSNPFLTAAEAHTQAFEHVH